MKKSIIISTLLLFILLPLYGQNGINMKPDMLLREIKKAEGHESFQLTEVKMPMVAQPNTKIPGKYFALQNTSGYKYVYVGRVNSCRAGGCNTPNKSALQSDFEFFDYFILFDSLATVKTVRVYNYEATHGQEVMIKAWLKQFEGYNGSNALIPGKNISAIAGATISVNNLVEDIIVRTQSLKTSLKPNTFLSYKGTAQGTTFHIEYQSADENIQAGIDSIFTRVNDVFSGYIPTSLVSRLNNRNTSEVNDSLFVSLFQLALKISEVSGGAFDITATSQVKKGTTDNYTSISIANNQFHANDSNTFLDFNAIAQGFTVDLISDWLLKKGIKNHMVELGGEIKCQGTNQNGEVWHIGIDNPKNLDAMNYTPESKFILQLTGKAVSVSGNYRQKGHIVNPTNAQQQITNNLLSVLVISSSCTEADALSTALFAMGLDAGKNFLNTQKHIDAVLYYTDAEGNTQIYQTPGMQNFVQKTDTVTK